jgi:hypothetical protein
MNNKLRNLWKKVVMAWFDILFPGGVKTWEKLLQSFDCVGRNDRLKNLDGIIIKSLLRDDQEKMV